MLVVIGPNWLRDDQEGFGPAESIRAELAYAFESSRPVVPVLVDNARLPDAELLPDEVRQLRDIRFLEIRQEYFDEDMDGLADNIRSLAGNRSARPGKRSQSAGSISYR